MKPFGRQIKIKQKQEKKVIIGLLAIIVTITYNLNATAPTTNIVHDGEVYFGESYRKTIGLDNTEKTGGQFLFLNNNVLGLLVTESPMKKELKDKSPTELVNKEKIKYWAYTFGCTEYCVGRDNPERPEGYFKENFKNSLVKVFGTLNYYSEHIVFKVGGTMAIGTINRYKWDRATKSYVPVEKFNYPDDGADYGAQGNIYDSIATYYAKPNADLKITYGIFHWEFIYCSGKDITKVVQPAYTASVFTIPLFGRWQISPYMVKTSDPKSIEAYSRAQLGLRQRVQLTALRGLEDKIWGSYSPVYMVVDCNYTYTSSAEGFKKNLGKLEYYYFEGRIIVWGASASCWYNSQSGIGGGIGAEMEWSRSAMGIMLTYNYYESAPLSVRNIGDKGLGVKFYAYF